MKCKTTETLDGTHPQFYIVYLTIFFSIASCVNIVKLPSKNDTDFYKERCSLEETQIKFIELDTSLYQLRHYSSVYLFATWCPHCYAFLSDFDAENQITTALLSSNYNVEIIEKRFSENIDTVYILSNEHYGDFEINKIQLFQEIATGAFDGSVGVPQVFVRQGDDFKKKKANALNK